MSTADEAKPYRRALQWLFIGIPVLCLLLSTCGAAVILNIDELKEENLPPDGGGLVLIEAPRSTCWEMKAYDVRHPDGSRGESDDEVPEYEVDEMGLEPFAASGCGPGEVSLPDDQVFGAIAMFEADDAGETHPLRGLMITVWLTRRAARVGADVRTYDSEYRDLYAEDLKARNPIPRLRSFSVASGRVRDALQERGFNPAGAQRAASASFQALLDSEASDVDTYRRLARQARHDAEVALEFVDISEKYLADGFPRTKKNWAAAFKARLAAFVTTIGPNGNEVAEALIDIAYDRQEAVVRGYLREGYFLDSALSGLVVLRELRPRQGAAIDALGAEIRALQDRQEAEERAREQAAQDRLDDLLSGGSNGGFSGGLSCDGDGDGICYE